MLCHIPSENHATCSYISGSGYASEPFKRCLFIDYVIKGIILRVKFLNIFISISLNKCFGCSKVLSRSDGSFEFPQHMCLVEK